MNSFTNNFDNLMKELEKGYTKAIGYNDTSKMREMQLLRSKAKAYQEILQPLKFDPYTNNEEVNKFYSRLKVFINKIYKQTDIILNKTS